MATTPLTPSALTPRLTRILAAALLAIMAILLISSARQESQTFDEATHLFAGFEYWKHGDFGRNPEHPPLAKLLAAMPLLPLGLKEPPTIPIPYFKAQDAVNGIQFLYTPNTDASALLFRGRLVMMLFSLALALLVFLAAREIFGPLAALFSLFLFVFEPLLIANGNLVTTDMALACLLFASVYTFYRFCNRPTAARLALCALATALTLVVKQSGLLVVPILLLLALTDLFLPVPSEAAPEAVNSGASETRALDRSGSQSHRPARRRLIPALLFAAPRNRQQRLRQLTLALCVLFAIGYLALWAIYGFRYAARPGQLQIIPTLDLYLAGLKHPLEQSLLAFAARHHLLPEAYLYGWVDILLIPGTRPTFLFGHIYSTGQWFFFPAVFLIKTTLAVLVFLALLPFARIANRRREFIFFSLPAAFYTIVAIASMMNMGARYLLPIYPYLILFAGASAAAFFSRSTISRVAVAALLLLTVVSNLHAWPNFLVYSNEAFGGPARTYRSLADPDADWGQGLLWTKTYLDHHPGSNCWFDYFGNPVLDPAYVGIPCRPLLSSFQHAVGFGPAPIPSTITGTVLISSSDTNGLYWGPDTLNPYRSFRDRTPDAVIGNIIFVYHGTFNLPQLAAESNATAALGLLRQGRLPEALVLAKTAARQSPDSADVNAVLGQILLASGRLPEGRQAIAQAIHLAQTNHPEFQQYLLSQLQHPPTQP